MWSEDRTLQFTKVGWAHRPARWERSRPECGSCSGGLEAASRPQRAALCSALAMCHSLTASNILHLMSTLTQLEQIMLNYNFLLKYIYVQHYI